MGPRGRRIPGRLLVDAVGVPVLTDGIDILQIPTPGFPSGLLAACDGCADDEPEDMDIVSWDRIAEAMKLARCPSGEEQSRAP